ncbi:MAG: hypothetical protein KOO60_09075 [Gemmatimonadales bacterium]|nr:hypothetical protein [Gemmatimonadales bacterium]
MKKSLALSALLIFCLLGGASAQAQSVDNSGISFRNQALGGAISDDFDLIYDPIELRFVNGVNVFTNLSNLSNNNELFMDDYSNNELFLGLSAENPWFNNVWSSVLFKFRDYRTPGYVSFDRGEDLSASGYGYLEGEYSGYLDSNLDGLLDTYNTYSYMEEDYTEEKNYDFILNNSAEISGLVVGLRFAKGHNEESETWANGYGEYEDEEEEYWNWGQSTYSWTERNHLLDEGLDTAFTSQSGDFDNLYERSYTSLSASAMDPDFWGSYELRGDLHFTSYLETDNSMGVYSRTDEDYNTEHDAYLTNDYLDYSQNEVGEYDGSELGFAISLRKTFDQQAERKNDGFWKVGMGGSLGSYDYLDHQDVTRTAVGERFDGFGQDNSDYLMDENLIQSESNDGTADTKGFYLGGLLNIPANEEVYFGIGAYFNKMSQTGDLANLGNMSYTTIRTVYEDSFTEEDDASDYVSVTTDAKVADHTLEYFSTSMFIPVGLEWKFTKSNKWAMRFGANFNAVRYTWNDLYQITSKDTAVTETVYGDGVVEVATGENEYISTTNQREFSETTVEYCYGLGYQPNENLQVDLLTIFDDTNDRPSDEIWTTGYLRRLRLSFSLKF